MNRIKSLDGIRGTFILIILVAHALETMPTAITENKILLFYIFNTGALGVKIFFVMSGYLITKLLVREQEKNGRVDIKDFYIRRMFRILPTFFLYIGVILILKWTIVPDIFTHYSLVLYAVFYLWNYKHLFSPVYETDKGEWFLGHFWSLSMEEQFYLLWPITFIKFSRPTLIKLLTAIILIMPFVRSATFLLLPGSKAQVGMMLHTGGDAILLGCLAALTEHSTFFKDKLFRYLQYNFVIPVTAIFLFIVSPAMVYHFKAAYLVTIGMSLNNLSIMILLYWCMYIPSKVSDLLNMRIISQLGVASYSLYIWQQLFLTSRNDLWVNKFPQNIIVAIAVGLGSHYFAEKPILNLKNRFKKV